MPHGIKKRLHRTSTQQKAMAFPEMQYFWCESVTEQNLVKNRNKLPTITIYRTIMWQMVALVLQRSMLLSPISIAKQQHS